MSARTVLALAGASAVAGLFAAAPGAAVAAGPLGPINDQQILGSAPGQDVARVPVQTGPEPALTATPLVACGPGAHEEPGVDGRVPGDTALKGLSCNVSVVSHHGPTGGTRVWRYVDPAGHACAFYDTTLVFPTNILSFDTSSLGVAVLDMADPAHPVQTATLTDPAMLSPHESLNLNARRGLLAAVDGNAAAGPGIVSVYDVHTDCRHPQLLSSAPVALLGHESGFAPDGRTFYATASNVRSVTAVDLTDPRFPHPVWQGNLESHGMSLSDDGNRAYVADPQDQQLLILDTSEIQARRPDPQVREISRLTWKSAATPQSVTPFTEDGHPYLLEFDEFTAGTTRYGFSGGQSKDDVGAARIIDIADERAPRVVANLRLAVDQPAAHKAAAGDPGASFAAGGYAAHYCNLPTRVDPKIVACSFIVSGLRLFDISRITAPKEIGYFVAPSTVNPQNIESGSNYAMSMPSFDVARHDVWYSDAGSGFSALHVADAVWPKAAAASPRTCASRRSVRYRLPRGVSAVRVTVDGRLRTVRRSGRTLVLPLAGLPRRAVHVRITALVRGRRYARTSVLHPCTAGAAS